MGFLYGPQNTLVELLGMVVIAVGLYLAVVKPPVGVVVVVIGLYLVAHEKVNETVRGLAG